MSLRRTIQTWDRLGKTQPLWAILNHKHKKDAAWETDEFFRTGEEEIAHVMEYFDSRGVRIKRSRALDFGCGAGRLSRALAHSFKRVIGVDAAPSMIALAQRLNRGIPACRFLLAPNGSLSLLQSHYFDFIYSSITLQHMEPRYARRYLKEFFRILSPGGTIAFQLPSERIAEVRTRRMLPRIKDALKRLVPLPLLQRYHQLRHGRDAFIEMYGTPREEVIGLLGRCGGSIIGV